MDKNKRLTEIALKWAEQHAKGNTVVCDILLSHFKWLMEN